MVYRYFITLGEKTSATCQVSTKKNSIFYKFPTKFLLLKIAGMNFKNMDKLIKYTNERYPSVNIFYSTPSCYLKALNDIGKTWPTKDDDFFPYSNDPHAYWTGYFSSRPAFKGTVRKTNTYLQVIVIEAYLAILFHKFTNLFDV